MDVDAEVKRNHQSKKESQLKECFHFSNLQPLWAEDNLEKRGKY
jgi:hypothetical protein